MIRQEEVFKIGQFAKPHGIKGELALATTSDVFDDSDDPYVVVEIDGILVPFFIETYRYKSDTTVLVKLEKIDTEEAAREFTGRDVYYPLDQVGEDSDLIGDITWDSLVGYTVSDPRYGDLGQITDVDETTLNVLLKIDREGEEWLLPAADELITEADHAGKRLTVSLPEGLLDL